MHINLENKESYYRAIQEMVYEESTGQLRLKDLAMKVNLNTPMPDSQSPGYMVYWNAREGRVEVAVMDNDRLINTLRYCIVNYEATKHSKIPELQSINGKSFEEWIDIFTQEYYYRKEIAKQQEIAKLRAEYEELKSREEKKADVVAKLKELGVEI